MAKKKKLDEFLHARKQSQESALEQEAQFSNRLFRFGSLAVVVLVLLALIMPRDAENVAGLLGLFSVATTTGVLTISQLSPGLFGGNGAFNRFIFLVLASVSVVPSPSRDGLVGLSGAGSISSA